MGSLLCILASFSDVLNIVLVKRILPENSAWRLIVTTNIWSTIFLSAAVAFSGEYKTIAENWAALLFSQFLFLLPLVGLLGFLVGASNSPLFFNISVFFTLLSTEFVIKSVWTVEGSAGPSTSEEVYYSSILRRGFR